MRLPHLFAVLLLAALPGRSWSAESGRPLDYDPARHRAGILLLDTSGGYLRVATDGPVPELIGEGRLWELPGARALREFDAHRMDGVLIEAVYDSRHALLHIAVPRFPFFGPDGTRGYRVASLRVPELEVSSYVDLEKLGGASLLLSPDASRLLVSYPTTEGEDAEWPNAARLLTLPVTAAGVARAPQADAVATAEALGEEARWVAGNRIVDQTTVFDAQGREIRHVVPHDTLGAWAQAAFPDLVRTGANGRPYLDFGYADSAAQRLLFVVNPESYRAAPPHGGLAVFDLVSDKAVAIRTPMRHTDRYGASAGNATAHLTPDGRRVVVEEHVTTGDPDAFVRRKTGTLRIHDAATGHLLATAYLADRPGFTGKERVTGFAEREQLLFYGNRDRLFVIDLRTGALRATLTLQTPLDPPGMRFYPDRAAAVVSYGPAADAGAP